MNDMQPAFTTIQEARRWASSFLRDRDRETRVADMLLEDLFGWSRAKLMAFETDPFPEEHREAFVRSVLAHAETGVPVQHLIGTAPFYGREFKVDRHVLIPRPETEELVHGIIGIVESCGMKNPRIADIGTGSGVIAVTAALEIPGSTVHAVDISEAALKVASENAQALGADVTFHQGDFYQPLMDVEVDILLSNPPYIAWEEKGEMADTVVDFDPELALFADKNGLAAYLTIVEQLSTCRQLPKCIAFEIGYQQGPQVKELLAAAFPTYNVEVKKDINGRDRMVFAFAPCMRM